MQALPTSRLPPHLKPLQSHHTAAFTVPAKLLRNLHFVAFWHPDLKSDKLIKPVGCSGSAQVVLLAESLLRKHSSYTVFATRPASLIPTHWGKYSITFDASLIILQENMSEKTQRRLKIVSYSIKETGHMTCFIAPFKFVWSNLEFCCMTSPCNLVWLLGRSD